MQLVLKYYLGHMSAAAGSNEAQSGSPIVYHIFEQLGPYIGNNAAIVDFEMVQCLWFIGVD